MLALAVLSPFRHGAIGALDELEFCVAPFVVMITIWLLRLFSLRRDPKRDRKRDRLRIKDSANSSANSSTDIKRKDR